MSFDSFAKDIPPVIGSIQIERNDELYRNDYVTYEKIWFENDSSEDFVNKFYKHPDFNYSTIVLPTIFERSLVEEALYSCNRSGDKRGDPWAFLYLIRLAKENGIQDKYLALLPAIWCHESSWSWNDEIYGDGGNSYGPLQLQKYLIPFCNGDNRHDLIWSAKCWLINLRRVEEKVIKICGKDDFLTTEAWVAGGRKYAPNCNVESQHASKITTWYKEAIEKIKRLELINKQCIWRT